MIRLASEHVISIGRSPPHFPRRRGGKRPHVATIFRWVETGVGADDGTVVVLETIRVGRTLCTSVEAIQRFCERLTPRPAPAHRPACHPGTPSPTWRSASRRPLTGGHATTVPPSRDREGTGTSGHDRDHDPRRAVSSPGPDTELSLWKRILAACRAPSKGPRTPGNATPRPGRLGPADARQSARCPRRLLCGRRRGAPHHPPRALDTGGLRATSRPRTPTTSSAPTSRPPTRHAAGSSSTSTPTPATVPTRGRTSASPAAFAARPDASGPWPC